MYEARTMMLPGTEGATSRRGWVGKQTLADDPIIMTVQLKVCEGSRHTSSATRARCEFGRLQLY